MNVFIDLFHAALMAWGFVVLWLAAVKAVSLLINKVNPKTMEKETP